MPRSARPVRPKFIFVTGGIVSGIGKGLSVASISLLLKSRGFSVLPIKIDPYLNKDAGTMNPFQHGEVFVTTDGAETDLDLGHYERFIDVELDRSSNFTTGSVYEQVIHLERRGDYLGKTIQIIPHVTGEIIRCIEEPARKKRADIVIIEVGGTVGDIEAEPFLEAIRQMGQRHGHDRVAFVHLVKMDYIFPSDEAKTKPIQQSVMLLRQRGIQPDFLIVRCKRALAKEHREKISLFTNVPPASVIEALDVKTLYQIPLHFDSQKLGSELLKRLALPERRRDLNKWRRMVRGVLSASATVKIALVGKYIEHSDAYLSVEEAVKHAAAGLHVKPEIVHLDSEELTNQNAADVLKKINAIIVPGGFGKRGIEGKIAAVRYARENHIPYLGLCLGMQVAVIEFARNVCKLAKAHSTEFDPRTPHPVIDILPEQKKFSEKGGTMRLGVSEMVLEKNSLAESLYGSRRASERHRHRYEVHPKYHALLQKRGLRFSGFALHDKRLVELVELAAKDHPYFIATQAHPEFKSRPLRPHPLFLGLLRAAKSIARAMGEQRA